MPYLSPYPTFPLPYLLLKLEVSLGFDGFVVDVAFVRGTEIEEVRANSLPARTVLASKVHQPKLQYGMLGGERR